MNSLTTLVESLQIPLAWQPGFVLLLFGIISLFLPRRLNDWAIPLAALLGLLAWYQLPALSGVADAQMTIIKTFALAFLLVTFFNGVYSVNQSSKLEQSATLIYAGSTISVLYAQDYLSFFIYWELTAISSVLIVWSGKLHDTYHAGMRYLAFQLVAGVLVLMGIIGLYADTQDLSVRALSLDNWYEWCFFLGFGIKAAFPLLHMWLPDAYPSSSPTGSVTLSAFTTKMAIFALLTHFSGQPLLIFIGAAMAIWPMLYMTLENDARRMIAYGLQNQFGYMVVAIGIGSDLAINGAVAHAFACTMYGALLYMVTGSMLKQHGTTKFSELSGHSRKYPILIIGGVIGAFTIAAFPFFVGFAAKSLELSALGKAGYDVIWLILVISSIAVIDAFAFKFIYYCYIKEPENLTLDQPTHKDEPISRAAAIGIILVSIICILPGILPHTFYELLLPYDKYWDYALNTPNHLVTQFELISFTLAGFLILKWLKLYPNQYHQELVDADVIYRKWVPELTSNIAHAYEMLKTWIRRSWVSLKFKQFLEHSEYQMLSRQWPTGNMVICVAVILMATWLLYFV